MSRSVDLDLNPNVLWHTLTQDVYSNQGSKGEVILSETSGEERPLLASSGLNSKLPKTKGSGWPMTAFLLVNTALGIGILNFPSAYAQAGGIFYATLIQIIMVSLMVSTMMILAYCSDLHGDLTYHDVMRSMCGRRGQQLAAVCITLTLYCVCVASLIVIGDQLDNLFHSALGPSFCLHWYLNRRFTISLVAILFILPLCFCKRVDFLGYVGSVGILVMLYPVFLTVYGYIKLDHKDVEIVTKPDNLSVMFSMFPVLGLGYQCQEVVVPIYSCMRKRSLSEFGKASALAVLFLMLVYSVTGVFGFLTFGSRVANNVMKMYDAQDPFVMVGTVALVLKMIATYPILALVGRDAVGGLYAELRGLSPAKFASTERSRRYIVAAIWFTTSLLLAIITKSIGIVIKYLGSVASANIFIYPGICLIQVVLMQDPELLRRRSPFLIGYGIFVAGVGAFCLGVVLLEAIMNTSAAEPLVDFCAPTAFIPVPLNRTVI